MDFFNKVLVVGLLVAISQLSASDAHAGGRSRTESDEQDITALVASLRAAVATTPPACADGKPGCIDCTTKGKCDAATGAGTLMPDGECPPGEACIVVGSTPVCKPIDETECNCGGANKGCDAFTNRPIFCVADSVYLDEPCYDPEQCSGAGECVFGYAPVDLYAVCAGNIGNNFQLLTPACTTGVFCADEEAVATTECKETEYFDLQSSSCKAFPPPNPCGCRKPKCPILGDCTKYAVCEGDTLIDEESCTDPAANQFDFDTQECVADTTRPTGLSADYKDCEFPPETSDESSSSGSPSSSPSSSGSSSSGSSSTSSFQCTNQWFSFSGSFSSVSPTTTIPKSLTNNSTKINKRCYMSLHNF